MKDSPGKELNLSHHLAVDLTSLKSGWVGGMGEGEGAGGGEGEPGLLCKNK